MEKNDNKHHIRSQKPPEDRDAGFRKRKGYSLGSHRKNDDTPTQKSSKGHSGKSRGVN